MTKLLYVPSGECIMFVANEEVFKETQQEYTADYEKSHWKMAWGDSPEAVVEQFCKQSNEHETKKIHKIPVDIDLDPKEFEILND